MFNFVVVFAACLTVAAAGLLHPSALAAAPAAVAYGNTPLYAAGGSQQIDVRHNYDGTLSSYTTTPFAYTSPVSSRYVAGPAASYAAPAANFGVPAAYAAPGVYAPPGFAASAPSTAAFPFASPFAQTPAKFFF